MSTSTTRTQIRRGLETSREVQRNRQAMLQSRQAITERRTSERMTMLGGAHSTAATERASLLARCDSLESILPARELATVRSELENARGSVSDGQQRTVRHLEQRATELWTRNRQQELMLRDIAVSAGAVAKPGSVRKRGDGSIDATLQFRDGVAMKVSVREGESEADSNPVDWHTGESNITTFETDGALLSGCEAQHAWVHNLAATTDLDVDFDDDSPGGASAEGRRRAA